MWRRITKVCVVWRKKPSTCSDAKSKNATSEGICGEKGRSRHISINRHWVSIWEFFARFHPQSILGEECSLSTDPMPPPFYGIIRAFPTPNTPFSDLTFFLSLPLEVSGLKYRLSLLQESYQVWKGQVFDQVVTLLVKLLVQVCIKIKTTKTGAEYCQHWCTPNRYVMKIKSPKCPSIKKLLFIWFAQIDICVSAPLSGFQLLWAPFFAVI